MVERRGRDLVKSRMCGLLSSAATVWLMYSEPLSAWKPTTANGNRPSRASSSGARKRSEIASTAPTNSYWVIWSTRLTRYTPLAPSRSPWWTVSTRRKPGWPSGRGGRHEFVGPLPIGGLKIHRLARLDEGGDLPNGANALELKCHDHLPMIPDTRPLGSLCVGIASLVKAHHALDKAALGRRSRRRAQSGSAAVRLVQGHWPV